MESRLGVGHSLGGSHRAAAEAPGAVPRIILPDSPILAAGRARARLVKCACLVDRVTPAGITRDRRATWASSDEAYAHFRNKRAFRDFDPDCLRDYVTLGMRPCSEGVCLAFDPSIEYRIYRAFPHDLAKAMPTLRVPAGFIFGRESADAKQIGLATTRRYFRVVRVEGGHLFPFERPAVAARAIREMAESLGAR
jgi:pimeloyl-ACP methyl ester carboxylesterase